MRALGILLIVLALIAITPALCAQKSIARAEGDVLDKIIAQERAEMESLSQYSPLVETYIQIRRPNKHVGLAPSGDKYFLGRALLAKGIAFEPLAHDTRTKHSGLLGNVTNFFSMEFLPRGFLQMIYLDPNGFDRSHYKFSYVRREFLGEVRCLVFDLDPRVKAEKGRFVGRIWVEDQGFHIVRFNGVYTGSFIFSYYFSFDSWRQNAGNNEWLPAFVFCEEGNVEYPAAKSQLTPAFRAQTRLWGYALGQVQPEQESTRVLVEAPVSDQTEGATGYSPLQANRLWTCQAEDNVVASLEKRGLMAPYGEVDKALKLVVNNLLATNGLVLPDEVSLAALLAHELGHIVLGHRMDTQFASSIDSASSSKPRLRTMVRPME